MIFSLPKYPHILPLLLAAFVACLACSLVPLANGMPLTVSPETLEGSHNHCSTDLDDAIRIVCRGQTTSLADLYPNSFGPVRTKRLVPDEIFYKPLSRPTHMCCNRPCTYSYIRQFCANT